jgi:hypothetical protein
MQFGLSGRAAAAVLTALLVLTTGGRGLCLMPVAAAPGTDAHDCCRDGLRAAPPPCCMTAAEAGPAARLTPPPVLPAVLPAAAPAPAVVAFRPLSGATPCRWDAARRDHSPPPTLRI